MTKITIVLEDTGEQVVLDARGDISKGSFMEFFVFRSTKHASHIFKGST